ncbi:hypothetical protein EV426DRAFT_270718 [Tirmania nivea]|nr:hypothetical protein EV426DRAFT_270718 [Tirmania nivea]
MHSTPPSLLRVVLDTLNPNLCAASSTPFSARRPQYPPPQVVRGLTQQHAAPSSITPPPRRPQPPLSQVVHSTPTSPADCGRHPQPLPPQHNPRHPQRPLLCGTINLILFVAPSTPPPLVMHSTPTPSSTDGVSIAELSVLYLRLWIFTCTSFVFIFSLGDIVYVDMEQGPEVVRGTGKPILCVAPSLISSQQPAVPSSITPRPRPPQPSLLRGIDATWSCCYIP